MAAIERNLAGICLTLEHLPNLLDVTDSTDTTAFRWAVTPGHEEVVKEFLNANAELGTIITQAFCTVQHMSDREGL